MDKSYVITNSNKNNVIVNSIKQCQTGEVI